MTSKELLYVKTIAEEKTLSKSAEKLGITQSALSHSLNSIEGRLGQPLFIRSSRNLVLTQAGEAYYSTAVDILKRYHELKCELGNLKQIPNGNLSVGMSRTDATVYLPLVLPDYVQRYPEVIFRLMEDSSLNILRELASNRLDCALINYAPDQLMFGDQLEYINIKDNPCVIAVRHGTKFKKEFVSRGKHHNLPVLDLRALSDQTYIRVDKNLLLSSAIDTALETAAVHPKVQLMTTDFETARRLAVSGMGFTIMPSSAMGQLGGEASDYYAFPDQYNAHWKTAFVYHKQSSDTLARSRFFSMIKDIIVRHIDERLHATI